ncbi:MAG: 3-keto-disaccharide hydrolase, partial [Gemmataceae bacterium]
QYWKIEGNVITADATEDPKYNTFFVSKEKYADFELSFKVLLKDEKGNSGVQIRSTLKDEKKFIVTGPQVDIGKGYWGSLYGEGVGGMMKQSDGEMVKNFVKGTEFNDYKIVAKGNRISITVNGESMIDDDFATTKDKKPLAAEGVIAFQLHGNMGPMMVQYKDIVFKKLK